LRTDLAREITGTGVSPLYSFPMERSPYRESGKLLLLYAFALTCVIGVSFFFSGCGSGIHPVSGRQTSSGSPFVVSIVSGRSDGLTMAKDNAREFYVVLTNVSTKPQPVFEYWNSWGYEAISFELTTTDGEVFALTTRSRDFDINRPSTFIVAPGEDQVFAVRFDGSWQVQPALPTKAEMPITLKAIYSVTDTPEAAKYGVWTGRVESHTSSYILFQY
jgi:hypothetical protein